MVIIKFLNKSSHLSEQGYTKEDQARIYDDHLQDVIDNVRFYLDNLEYLREFRVCWIDYSKMKWSKPYKFVKNPRNSDNNQNLYK